MFKRFAAMLAATVLLAGCSQASIFESQPVRSGIEFEFQEIEGSLFTMLYEPVADAPNTSIYGLNMPEPIDCDWTGEDDFNSNYSIYNSETGESYATVRVQTAPESNLARYFKRDTRDEAIEAMRSRFFTTQNTYNGLKKAVVEDFKYDLTVDWTGTALGYQAFYLEFIDEGSQNHALRFYMCNDSIDENFYAFEFRADLPMDDQELIEQYRSILFSLHDMS